MSNALSALARDGIVLRCQGRGTRVLPISEHQGKPSIAVVHVDLVDAPPIERTDSLRTLQGAREKLDQLGCTYELIDAHTFELTNASKLKNAHNVASAHRFTAVLFIECCYTPDLLAELQKNDIPVVVAKLESNDSVSGSWVDHQEPMQNAVRMLSDMGHKRIAFIGRDPSYFSHGAARNGYLEGLREANLPVDEPLIAVCEKTDALSAYFSARQLLSLSKRPTAIVAARDSLAEGVFHAIKELGFSVGHDVSLIGFDDTTWPEGRQHLTTFREDCYEIGAVATEMLVDRISNPDAPIEKRKLESALLLRRTAGPCSQYLSHSEESDAASSAASTAQ